MTSLSRSLVALVLVALTVAGCSDDGGATTTTPGSVTSPTERPTTTAVSGDFVFGSGVLPETVPEDFPIPNGATIDTTLVNTVTGFTEVAIVVPAQVDVVALFFEQNLQARDYEYDAEPQADGARWTVTFAKDGVSGTIDIASANPGISRAAVTIPGTG